MKPKKRFGDCLFKKMNGIEKAVMLLLNKWDLVHFIVLKGLTKIHLRLSCINIDKVSKNVNETLILLALLRFVHLPCHS